MDNTGPWSNAVDGLRTLLANSSTWQDLTRTADAASAKALAYRDAKLLSSLSPPYAVIMSADPDEGPAFQFIREAMSEYIDRYRMMIVLQIPTSLGVTALSQAAGTATATCADHGFATGDNILISGADQTAYNGLQAITKVDADTFTYSVAAGTATPATGTVVAGPDDRESTADWPLLNNWMLNWTGAIVADMAALANENAYVYVRDFTAWGPMYPPEEERNQDGMYGQILIECVLGI